MLASSFSISLEDLWSLIGTPRAPQIIDVRRRDLDAAANGQHAVSHGLSVLAEDDDHGMIRHGFMVYDALFARARFAAEKRHNWPAWAA